MLPPREPVPNQGERTVTSDVAPAPATPAARMATIPKPEAANPPTLWTGATVSGLLLVIAIGGWLLAWLIHIGVQIPFAGQDFGTRTFLVASASFTLLLLVKVPQWQVASLSG